MYDALGLECSCGDYPGSGTQIALPDDAAIISLAYRGTCGHSNCPPADEAGGLAPATEGIHSNYLRSKRIVNTLYNESSTEFCMTRVWVSQPLADNKGDPLIGKKTNSQRQCLRHLALFSLNVLIGAPYTKSKHIHWLFRSE